MGMAYIDSKSTAWNKSHLLHNTVPYLPAYNISHASHIHISWISEMFQSLVVNFKAAASRHGGVAPKEHFTPLPSYRMASLPLPKG
jgi:hypothetical protein